MNKIYDLINKNKKKTLIFILVLTLLSSIPVFIFPGIKQGDDTYFHLSRILALSKNIKEFNFFQGVYPGYFDNYGYANGLFYPDIFLYIPACLTALGVNLIVSYKLFLILINFFSILSMYICIKGISNNKYPSTLGSIIYAFSSYRLVDMYERAALGETLAFVFLPLVIYGIYEIIFKDKNKFYFLVIGMSGLIFTHIISTYIIGIILTILCLLNIKKILKEKRLKYIIISAIITLLITSYFLIPMLEQMESQTFYYSNTPNIDQFVLAKRTVPIYLLFIEIPNLFNVLFKTYWIPSGIGIIFLYLIYKKYKNKEINDKFINQNYIISIITLLLISFKPFWKLSLIKKIFYPIQFPWRFYIVPTLLLTICGSILISKIKENKVFLKNTFIISMISLVSMFIICIIPNRLREIKYYDSSFSEYLPIEVDIDYINNRGNIITFNNNVNHSFTKNGINMKINFDNNNYENTYMELPLVYYKGYTASIDKNNLDLFKTENGLVGVRINNIKNGIINVKYEGTKISKITKYISTISFILFVLYVKRGKNEK